MLKQLYIKNFTLIDELNISLYPGFSVITRDDGEARVHLDIEFVDEREILDI